MFTLIKYIKFMLTRSVRRPDDDRLKRSKHVASYRLNRCACWFDPLEGLMMTV